MKAVRTSGDITLSWVRRTRIGGDSWESIEVALAEDGERYDIDVLDGMDVVRTISATAPSAGYTAAQQIADFGAPQASVALRVYQVGAVYGRGTAAAATL